MNFLGDRGWGLGREKESGWQANGNSRIKARFKSYKSVEKDMTVGWEFVKLLGFSTRDIQGRGGEWRQSKKWRLSVSGPTTY